LPSFEYDLNYLQACLVEMESYLLSSEVYWPVEAYPPTGEPPYPRLTLGGVLLARARLTGRELTLAQEVQLARVVPELETVRSHWRTAWGQKAKRSFHNRLEMWRNFLYEYRQDPEAHADRYAYEVRLRVMVEMLFPEAGEIPQEDTDLLTVLDAVLKGWLIPGKFIWEQAIQNGFPSETYWYLYGYLSEQMQASDTPG
jgi:hypothetical protein